MKRYEMPGKAITCLFAVSRGALLGKFLAELAPVVFSGVGNVANAAITYSLHQIQGRMIIDWCEKNYNNPNVLAMDIAACGISLAKAPAGDIPINNPPPDSIKCMAERKVSTNISPMYSADFNNKKYLYFKSKADKNDIQKSMADYSARRTDKFGKITSAPLYAVIPTLIISCCVFNTKQNKEDKQKEQSGKLSANA